MEEDKAGSGKLLEPIVTVGAKLLTNLLEPASKELGELWGAMIKARRARLERMCEGAGRLVQATGREPQVGPSRVLIPILENGSLEDEDDNLAAKWVGLLASAAAGDRVHSSYPKLLAELTPEEARMLDAIYQKFLEKGAAGEPARLAMPDLRALVNLPMKSFQIAVSNLSRLGLCAMPPIVGGISAVTFASREVHFALTPLGEDFVATCQGPRARDA